MQNLNNEISIGINGQHFSYKVKNFNEEDVKVNVSDRVYGLLCNYAKDHNFNNDELKHIDLILAQITESNMHLFKDLLISKLD